MALGVVSHLIAHARSEGYRAAILQLRMQLAFQAQQDVALLAPVISQIAWRVLHHPYPNIVELARAPVGHAGVARVFGAFNRGPVRGAKGDVCELHAVLGEQKKRPRKAAVLEQKYGGQTQEDEKSQRVGGKREQYR